jgi:segregation and condensation protein B
VVAYRQPVTLPEIDEIRGVDSGGVIHTLMEKRLVVTAGRKSVVGRPILYRTSRDFLVHFGLKDVGELPSLKEFEELAKRALGSEWTGEEASTPGAEPAPVSTEEPGGGAAEAARASSPPQPGPPAAQETPGENREVTAPTGEPSAPTPNEENAASPPEEAPPATGERTP